MEIFERVHGLKVARIGTTTFSGSSLEYRGVLVQTPISMAVESFFRVFPTGHGRKLFTSHWVHIDLVVDGYVVFQCDLKCKNKTERDEFVAFAKEACAR